MPGSVEGWVNPRLHIFLATSPIHREYKLKMSKEQIVETSVAAVKYAAAKFPVVQWSAEDASRTELDFLAEIVEKVIQAVQMSSIFLIQ